MCVVGIALMVSGLLLFLKEAHVVIKVISAIAILSGIYFTISGIREMMRLIIGAILPARHSDLVDIIYTRRHLSRGPNIVAIGGGTGLSVLLHGLKKYTSNISAVVTVADDGGSSGRLRKEYDVLPPGDIRNCLVALADTEPLMRDLFQFRFEEKSALGGHTFGNLFITAMTKLTGDFEKAIKASSQVLAIRGQVIPSTLKSVTLVAKHKNGQTTKGETQITAAEDPIDKVYLEPAHCDSPPEVKEAIAAADAIILGPGSLYTSIIPNLLIKDITRSILKSNAIKVYVCNVMTQSHETDGFTASDHLKVIVNHTHPKLIDYVVVNTQKIPQDFLVKYREENAYPVNNDVEKIRQMGYEVIEENVINTVNHVRHNPDKLSKIIIDLISDLKTKS